MYRLAIPALLLVCPALLAGDQIKGKITNINTKRGLMWLSKVKDAKKMYRLAGSVVVTIDATKKGTLAKVEPGKNVVITVEGDRVTAIDIRTGKIERQEQERQEREAAAREAEEQLWAPLDVLDLSVGKTGTLPHAGNTIEGVDQVCVPSVSEILGPREALVTFRIKIIDEYGISKRREEKWVKVILSGVDTSSWVDGAEIKPDDQFKVKGTRKLGSRTLYVLERQPWPKPLFWGKTRIAAIGEPTFTAFVTVLVAAVRWLLGK
jgi:hypothetical protein